AAAASSTSGGAKTVTSMDSPSSSGTLTSATAWLSMDAGSTTARFAVYAADGEGGLPKTRLAQSNTVTISGDTATEYQFTFSGSERIQIEQGTDYWFGPAWQSP